VADRRPLLPKKRRRLGAALIAAVALAARKNVAVQGNLFFLAGAVVLGAFDDVDRMLGDGEEVLAT